MQTIDDVTEAAYIIFRTTFCWTLHVCRPPAGSLTEMQEIYIRMSVMLERQRGTNVRRLPAVSFTEMEENICMTAMQETSEGN